MAEPAPAVAARARRPRSCDDSALERIELELLLEGIYRQYGYDFREYALGSLRRRLWRRAHAEGARTLSALQDRVLHDPACMQRLLHDLSINVTVAVPRPDVLRARSASRRCRCFAPTRSSGSGTAGCASGEEAYSLAILLHEEGLYERTRIYATDINEAVLARARAGRFPADRLGEYGRNHERAGGSRPLADYVRVDEGSAVFVPELAEHIVFAEHDLVTDRSFNEFHVILCRNVMIYFSRALQDDVHAPVLREPGAVRRPRPGAAGVASLHAVRGRLRDARREREAVPEGRLTGAMRALVVIGASWGGLDALGVVLGALPRRFAAPVAIVQHRSATLGDDGLAETIDRGSAAAGVEADDKDVLEPGTVYLAPADYHLLVERRGQLALSVDERSTTRGRRSTCSSSRPPTPTGRADRGPADRGQRGRRRRPAAIHERGGLCVVQDPATAGAPQMPQAAIDAGAADVVAPLPRDRRAPDRAARRDGQRGRRPVTREHPAGRRPAREPAGARGLLEPLGRPLIARCPGDEALKKLLAEDFAVILLDVQMPGMDGFETADYIKRLERTSTSRSSS